MFHLWAEKSKILAQDEFIYTLHIPTVLRAFGIVEHRDIGTREHYDVARKFPTCTIAIYAGVRGRLMRS